MRLRLILGATVMICAALQNQAGAQEQAKGDAKAALNQQEMMKKWMEAASPGEGHKYLGQMVGKWDLTLRAWMDPGKPPQESKGTCDAKWILDGRFVYAEKSRQNMGMPFKSVEFWGYD